MREDRRSVGRQPLALREIGRSLSGDSPWPVRDAGPIGGVSAHFEGRVLTLRRQGARFGRQGAHFEETGK